MCAFMHPLSLKKNSVKISVIDDVILKLMCGSSRIICLKV
jgi:hypothetical protein